MQLLTKKEFQEEANRIKQEKNISRCQANELLAKKHGFKCYAAIKDKLTNEDTNIQILSVEDFNQIEKARVFSQASKVTTYFKGYNRFESQELIEGVAYNPILPTNFWNNPNGNRDYKELLNWWDIAFILSNNKNFLVYRLDGGAWDRPTRKSSFGKFEDALIYTQKLNKIDLTNENKYKTLSTGAVINAHGLFISKDGKRTTAPISDRLLNPIGIKKATIFSKLILEKKEKINRTKGTSYTLKHRVEEFLYHYYKNEDNYISSGEMIYALDLNEFEIYERRELGKKSNQIFTNYETLKEFTYKIQNGEYDIHKKKYEDLLNTNN